jgi:hypothetical protein
VTAHQWAGLFVLVSVVLLVGAVCAAAWHLPEMWRAPAYMIVGSLVSLWIGVWIERLSRNP